jgi:hypothetical protein
METIQYKYGKKLEVKGGNYIIEVIGKIPKSTPYVVNQNTEQDRFNVRINGIIFTNLTESQLDLLVSSGTSHLDITEQENLEPIGKKKEPVTLYGMKSIS